MAYATVANLATYLGKAEVDLAPESARLLNLASELIDYVTLGRVDTTDTAQMIKVRDAACAQVEYWLETGDPNGIVAQSTRMGFGTFNMDGKLSMLGPRVRQILQTQGLTFRGVGQSTKQTLPQTFFKRPGGNQL